MKTKHIFCFFVCMLMLSSCMKWWQKNLPIVFSSPVEQVEVKDLPPYSEIKEN